MFWDFLGSKDPLGVRLSILKQLLEASKINVRSERNALIVRRDNYSMRFDVLPHDGREKAGNPIQAVVRVVADLPGPVHEFLDSEEALDAFNALATLGAFTREGNRRYIGSRLTIYKDDLQERRGVGHVAAATVDVHGNLRCRRDARGLAKIAF